MTANTMKTLHRGFGFFPRRNDVAEVLEEMRTDFFEQFPECSSCGTFEEGNNSGLLLRYSKGVMLDYLPFIRNAEERGLDAFCVKYNKENFGKVEFEGEQVSEGDIVLYAYGKFYQLNS